MTAKRTDSFGVGMQDVPKPPVPQPSGPVTSGVPDAVRQQAKTEINQEGAVRHFASGVHDVVDPVENFVVDWAKGVGRLGAFAVAGKVPGIKDPYATADGGTRYGQLALDAASVAPWGKIVGVAAKPVIKAAKPIVSKIGDIGKYTKPILPETPFGVSTGNVAAAGAGERLPFTQGIGRKLATGALAAGGFLGGVTAGAGRAASPAVVKMISPGAVERATVENLSKIAGSASVKDAEKAAVKEVFENTPTKPLKDLPDAAGKTAKDTNVNPGLTNLAPNVAVNTITQGTRQQQATSQDKGPTDKGKQKPKEKPKIKKPVVLDEGTGTGQTATIPVIN